tara:strand:+ start:1280 stop:2269 length:990 start_codon:yes stop_codon:yes gene_type:complete
MAGSETIIDAESSSRDLEEVESKRFSFTKKLGPKPSSAEYNSLLDDFTAYLDSSSVGGGITRHNLEAESIRFRHLEENPVRVKFKDCSESIWKATPANLTRTCYNPSGAYKTPQGRWDLFSNSSTRFGAHATDGVFHDLMIRHNVDPDEPLDRDLAQISLWYYPYQLHQEVAVCPAVLTKGIIGADQYHWHPLSQHRRRLGIGVGFYGELEAVPYDVNRDGGIVHPYANVGSGTVDPSVLPASVTRPGTAAHGGPVICTATLPRDGILLPSHTKHYDGSSIDAYTVNLSDIIGFGMMVKIFPESQNDHQTSRCSVYDRLFINLVTRSGV